MSFIIVGNECDFVASAISNYNAADNVVKMLEDQRRMPLAARKSNMAILRDFLQTVETNLWEALARDFPQFKFRRQNQTIVINYSNSSQTVYINPGEVNKIRGWGVNDYYEALDTINRIQNRLWNVSANIERRWKDDWKRLGKQLMIINNRNCKGLPEPKPGIIILPPPTIPMPPVPPGPQISIYPLPPIPSQPTWSDNEKRNWGLTGWAVPTYTGLYYVSALSGAPQITIVNGRELVYFRNPNTSPTKIVWLFHGAGGSARSWFTQYEKVKYVKKLVDAGYMVAAYDSYNRISGKWAPTVNPDTNKEILAIKACQLYLGSLGILPSTQYGVGMSSGGAMVSYAAASLGLSKVIIHNATGIYAAFTNSNYTAKTMWVVSNNDLLVNNSEVNDVYNYVLANKPNLTPQYHIQQATFAPVSMFDDIPNISTPVASAINIGLRNAGFLNQDGTVATKYLMAGRTVREQYMQDTIPTIIAAAFGNDGETYRKYVKDIIDQIKIAFSDHEFSGLLRSDVNGSLVLTDVDLNFLNA